MMLDNEFYSVSHVGGWYLVHQCATPSKFTAILIIFTMKTNQKERLQCSSVTLDFEVMTPTPCKHLKCNVNTSQVHR